MIFSAMLGWLPSIYDTTHRVTDLDSLVYQVKQMIMPVMVLALFNAAQISRFTRSAVLDTIHQEYVRTARAKGLTERVVVLIHVLRNSMIPVVTVIALGIPADRGDRGGGHPDGADRDLHLRGADRDVQSGRGPAVRRPGSPHPL